jgi:hypothetical protein
MTTTVATLFSRQENPTGEIIETFADKSCRQTFPDAVIVVQRNDGSSIQVSEFACCTQNLMLNKSSECIFSVPTELKKMPLATKKNPDGITIERKTDGSKIQASI